MAEIDKHAAGTFSWPELVTTDRKGGVAFYSTLFGWGLNEQPMGPTETYSMFTLRGKEVAAAYTMRPDERQLGIPPHWNSYVTVDNVDETAKQASAFGGTVLAPPFDVLDAGRMAVLQDPTGAVFQVWQPKRHIGAKIIREPGALTWTELSTRDTKAAQKFYSQLLGWSAKVGGEGVNAYTEFTPKGASFPTAGMMDLAMLGDGGANIPPHWMPYFQVDDVDATANKAKSLGATWYVPPSDIPNVGRFSTIADPQRAVFAIYKPK
jgi:uncharacterized protein